MEQPQPPPNGDFQPSGAPRPTGLPEPTGASQPADANQTTQDKDPKPRDSAEGPVNAPAPTDPSEAPGERTSRVNISFELAKGTRVRVTVEALGPQDGATRQGAGNPVVVNVKQAAQVPGTVFISQPGAEATPARSVPSPVKPTALPQGVAGLPKGTVQERVRQPGGSLLAGVVSRLRETAQQAVRRIAWPYNLATTLFGLAIIVYLVTHLIGLTSFPIYFFTDEAIQTMSAEDLVHNGFRDANHTLLPTYFKNGSYYNLSASVYLQVIPYLIFGVSAYVTRATSVLITLLAVFGVGLILRDIFKIPYWWAGPLLLSIAPAWFLHSRTAFETVIFVSFYAAMLGSYLLYRYRSPKYLYPTLTLAAFAFYSYSPGQVVVAVTTVLLFFSDLRYHWQNRRTILWGAALLVILALPYIRFRLIHSSAPLDHLRELGSYLVQPLSLKEKINRFVSTYLYGLSPAYWFIPNETDLPRHLMKGYGHLLVVSAPFFYIGLLNCLLHLRSSAHRTLLIATLAAPTGSALVGVGITRELVFVIPATLLTGLGLSAVLEWVGEPSQKLKALPQLSDSLKLKPLSALGDRLRSILDGIASRLERWKLSLSGISIGLCTLLVVVNFSMLRDALTNGPRWYEDYTMGGMQWGAYQIFSEIQNYLERHPDTKIIFSPNWANGTDAVARFFLPDPTVIQMGSIDGHMNRHLPLDDKTLFIMLKDEYDKTVASGKFTDIRIEKIIYYPNNQPGFYFVRLRYVDNIDEILANESNARRELKTGEIKLDGQPVQVRYSVLDMGSIDAMFDGDPHSVARGLESNPLIVELTFPEARTLNGVSVIIGSVEEKITARLYATPDASPVEYSAQMKGTIEQPEVTLNFGQPTSAKVLRLEILNPFESEPSHIHVWEITLH